jgi:adenosine deaminase
VVPARDLRTLPKAHLHLHFTGSMRHETLVELAARDGIVLPDALVEDWPPRLSAADEKGWFRFQRLYDVARSVLRTPDDVRRLVREAAEDDVADGGRWLEIQVDPSGYAALFGGITAFTDLVLDAVQDASRSTGLGMAVVIAANRTRHPLDARTLARLAAQYAGRGVVGFGLSNDERRGTPPTSRRLLDRRAGRAAARPARRRAARPGQRADLPRRPARRPARARGAGRRGPGAAGPGGRPGRRARGVPGLQRRARRLQRPQLGAAAHAAGGRRHVALGADDPLLFGPGWPRSTTPMRTAHQLATRSSRTWPGCRCGRPRPRRSQTRSTRASRLAGVPIPLA